MTLRSPPLVREIAVKCFLVLWGCDTKNSLEDRALARFTRNRLAPGGPYVRANCAYMANLPPRVLESETPEIARTEPKRSIIAGTTSMFSTVEESRPKRMTIAIGAGSSDARRRAGRAIKASLRSHAERAGERTTPARARPGSGPHRSRSTPPAPGDDCRGAGATLVHGFGDRGDLAPPGVRLIESFADRDRWRRPCAD